MGCFNQTTSQLKIPAVPPLLVNGKFISDFCEKVNLFNNFFASICTPIKNSSVLPVFSYRSIARTSFHFTAADIPLMIKTSGSDKARGCDKMSKKMIRVCSESPTVSLKVIFEQWLTLRKKFAYSYLSIFIRMREYTDQKNSEYRSLSRRVRKEGKFLEIWKKTNVVPVHIREDKNLLKNYCPISLLPNIFERVIYNSLFNHFQSSKLFISSQSRFLPCASYIAQLLSIIHESVTQSN